MANKISVRSGGGAVSVGHIVQGDRNQIGDHHANSTSVDIDVAVDVAKAEAKAIAKKSGREADIAMVENKIDQLGQEAKRPKPNSDRGAQIIKVVRENFSWAYPLMRDLLQAIWPKLISSV